MPTLSRGRRGPLTVAVVAALAVAAASATPAHAAERVRGRASDQLGDVKVVSGSPGKDQKTTTDIKRASIVWRRDQAPGTTWVSIEMVTDFPKSDPDYPMRVDVGYDYTVDGTAYTATGYLDATGPGMPQGELVGPHVTADMDCAPVLSGLTSPGYEALWYADVPAECLGDPDTVTAAATLMTKSGASTVSDRVTLPADAAAATAGQWRRLRGTDPKGDAGYDPWRGSKFADILRFESRYDPVTRQVALRVKLAALSQRRSQPRQVLVFGDGNSGEAAGRAFVPGSAGKPGALRMSGCDGARMSLDRERRLLTVTFPSTCGPESGTFTPDLALRTLYTWQGKQVFGTEDRAAGFAGIVLE